MLRHFDYTRRCVVDGHAVINLSTGNYVSVSGCTHETHTVQNIGFPLDFAEPLMTNYSGKKINCKINLYQSIHNACVWSDKDGGGGGSTNTLLMYLSKAEVKLKLFPVTHFYL